MTYDEKLKQLKQLKELTENDRNNTYNNAVCQTIVGMEIAKRLLKHGGRTKGAKDKQPRKVRDKNTYKGGRPKKKGDINNG